MTSERQRAANRRNAQLSAGPKSSEGRRKVRLNALKHGLSARHPERKENPPLLDANPTLNEARQLMEKIERYRRELIMSGFHLLRRPHTLEKMVNGMNRLVTKLNRLKRYEARAHALMRKGSPKF